VRRRRAARVLRAARRRPSRHRSARRSCRGLRSRAARSTSGIGIGIVPAGCAHTVGVSSALAHASTIGIATSDTANNSRPVSVASSIALAIPG
jgi:hypothetical protein